MLIVATPLLVGCGWYLINDHLRERESHPTGAASLPTP